MKNFQGRAPEKVHPRIFSNLLLVLELFLALMPLPSMVQY